MFFGVPPPNQDPSNEGEHSSLSPKDRLDGFIYGIGVVTLVLVVAAILIAVL